MTLRPATRLMAVAGAVAALGSTAVFVREFGTDASGLLWLAPGFTGYAGGIVAVRARPDLATARRLLLFGVLSTAWIGVTVGVITAYEDVGRRWWLAPGNVAVQLLGLAMWAAMISLLAVYPDDTARRRSLVVLARTVAVLAVAVPLGLLVVEPEMHPAWMFAWDEDAATGTAFPAIRNALHVPFLAFLAVPLGIYLDAALAGSTVLAAAVGVLRYRSLPPAERGAMRWPMYGVVALLLAPLAGLLQALGALSSSMAQVLQIAAVSALPASLAVGLVRPDLFDVDRVMRRSVAYAALWTAIALAYVGGAAALGYAAPGEGLQLAIAATAAASLLFEPGRRYLARRAARWAYGETVTGEELVRRVGGALEHGHDLGNLVVTVAAIAREGLGVRWVRLRVDGVGTVVAGEPPGDPAATAPLAHGADVVGEIECGPALSRPGGCTPEVDRELLTTLAGQVALAVRNARLVTELGASRTRIVTAHENARRQIERDIHDGAQQELAALIAGIGLAKHQAAADPDALAATLAGLQAEAGNALENLRRLAAGIHPSVLSDHGLVEAIEIRSARLPVAVTVDCDEDVRRARFGDEVEGAAYFFVSEALANTLKHAAAERARVRVVRDREHLEVAVSDDGCGFDPVNGARTGLRGLADRIEAIGGTLDVWSAPSRGTRLTARLPL